MTATLAPRLSKNVDRKVIVILKSQLAPAHVGSRAATLRSEVTTAYQTVRERPAPGVRLCRRRLPGRRARLLAERGALRAPGAHRQLAC
jgi:hypothetical protein